MPALGKVRIANGGDTIQAAHFFEGKENLRDMSYVRVCKT
jgi:hypothetical protein